MQTETLRITGMSCGACVGHVMRALEALDGVQSAQVSLEDGQGIVIFDPAAVNAAQMAAAVAEEGYEAAPIAEEGYEAAPVA